MLAQRMIRATRVARRYPACIGLAALPLAANVRCVAIDAAGASTKTKYPICFVAQDINMKHPEKKQSEDSTLVSSHAIAVADGIGGYADIGVDPGLYSRALIANIKQHTAARIERNGSTYINPVEAIASGQGANCKQKVPGGTTIITATAGSDGQAHIANIGDSAAMVWRYERPMTLVAGPHAVGTNVQEAAKLWTLRLRTKEQTFSFNFPYQLDSKVSSTATAQLSDSYIVDVEPGDLLVLASDGLYDNLFDEQIRLVLATVDFRPCIELARMRRQRYLDRRREAAEAEQIAAGMTPEEIKRKKPLEDRTYLGVKDTPLTDVEVEAKEREVRSMLTYIASRLALMAQIIGKDEKSTSPFSVEAEKMGYNCTGGKLDDVGIVLALVVPDETAVPMPAVGKPGFYAHTAKDPMRCR